MHSQSAVKSVVEPASQHSSMPGPPWRPSLPSPPINKSSYLNRRVRRISLEALEVMAHYPWPGNVRQLENAIQHGLIVEGMDTIQPLSLPFRCNSASASLNQESKSLHLREKLNLYEKQLIEEALARGEGKKKKAAALLGIHPKNLSRLLHKYKL